MEHILSLSYGKDSIACLGAIEQLGWKLERIVHAEVWATDTISADLPEMIKFKAKVDETIKKRYGIEVEHVYATVRGKKRTYENTFYQIQAKSKNEKFKGNIMGFAGITRNWCNSALKVAALKKVNHKESVSYIGIAADELKRLHRLTDMKRSPLVIAGWTEDDCRKWCEENDLLSPIYVTSSRSGCWFCHNQRVEQLRRLRNNYPELWKLMLKWDKDSPVMFRADGHTVHDFENRFQLEDEGFIFPNEKFRWSMLDEKLNYRWF